MGRGGSDTTAVALAIVYDADRCQIFTDVDGVYPVDPRLVPEVERLKQIDFGLMYDFAQAGAGVVHHRAVKIAQRFGLDLEVLLSPSRGETKGGTIICNEADKDNLETHFSPTLVAAKSNLSIIEVDGIKDLPGESAKVSGIFNDAYVNIDEKQQGSGTQKGTAKQDFIVINRDGEKIIPILQELRSDLKTDKTDGWAKLSVVDPRKAERPGLCYRVEKAMGDANVNMRMQGSSGPSYWVVVAEEDKQTAARALAKEFHLIKD